MIAHHSQYGSGSTGHPLGGGQTAVAEDGRPHAPFASPARPSLRRWFVRRALRLATLVYLLLLSSAKKLGRHPRRRQPGQGCDVLLTGTFYSDNWITAHIRPLAASNECARLFLVSTYPIPPTPKVVAVYPPRWMQRVVGGVPARLLTFAWCAIRKRPHAIGGFHLLVNGLVAAIIAPLAGARSMYFCVGGPSEVLDGGIWSENRIFGRLETSDPVIEKRLIRAVDAFDLVVTMGSRAAQFFREHGASPRFEVVSGGIDAERFEGSSVDKEFDLIVVARLAAIKRLDVFLHAVRLVARQRPETVAVIVGDGRQRTELEQLTADLGITRNVRFAGHQADVAAWLHRARIFVLTSDSEGLALSLMEAMMCGLCPVVSNVGDLGDLVEDGVNGFLVERRRSELFADRILSLLRDPDRLLAMSDAARTGAMQHESSRVCTRWDQILADVVPSDPNGASPR